MGKVLLEEQNLIDIANSIRNKTGSNETMKPSEMATNIDGIESGGTDLSEYFTETITGGNQGETWQKGIKKIPAFKNTGTTANSMFDGYRGLELDLSNIDISLVTSMIRMFYGCMNLTSLDVSHFNTQNVTSMNQLFSNCYKLTNLDLNNFNTHLVKDMNSMFYSCDSLTSLNLSNFITNNVTTFYQMFYSCDSLTSLNLSSFTGESLTNVNSMFSYCKNLMYLDIRNLDFANVTNYSNMFGSNTYSYVPANCLIIVKDETAKTWITSKFSRLTNVKTVAEYESGV